MGTPLAAEIARLKQQNALLAAAMIENQEVMEYLEELQEDTAAATQGKASSNHLMRRDSIMDVMDNGGMPVASPAGLDDSKWKANYIRASKATVYDKFSTPYISRRFPTVVHLKGCWTEINCKICGANADAHPVGIIPFGRLVGLRDHVEQVHKIPATIPDLKTWCGTRQVSQADADLMLKGEDPVGVPIDLQPYSATTGAVVSAAATHIPRSSHMGVYASIKKPSIVQKKAAAPLCPTMKPNSRLHRAAAFRAAGRHRHKQQERQRKMQQGPNPTELEIIRPQKPYYTPTHTPDMSQRLVYEPKWPGSSQDT